MREVKCKMCQTIFLSEHKNSLLCSDECREARKRELQNEKYKLGLTKKQYKPKKPTKKICVICDEPFKTTHKNKKTCGDDCAKELQRNTIRSYDKVRASRYKPIKKKLNQKWLRRGTIQYEGYRSL